MSIRALGALLIVVALIGGCAAPATQLTNTPPAPKAAGAASDLNPIVAPPPADIKVADNLPTVQAPAGFITQDAARDSVVAAMRKGHPYGTLILSELTFDAANKMWMAAFQSDGRAGVSPRGHGPHQRLSDDPAQERKLQHSWVSVADQITVGIDAVTGEIRGGGFRSGKVQPDRKDLEHYLGRIVTGGEMLKLRLTMADGTPIGRDIDLSVPQDALTNGGLSVWQLEYGQGRLLEVWGLTGAPNSVVAHRIAMPDPPPESLLAAPIVGELPLFPDAYTKGGNQQTIVLHVKETGLVRVQAWYAEQLPAYGWKPTAIANTFESAAQEKIQMELAVAGNEVTATFTRSTIVR